MSHAEYVAKLDEDQLTSLIEHAQGRLQALRTAGWTLLWVVGTDMTNSYWFNDYAKAAVCLGEVALASAVNKKDMPLTLEYKRYRPEEAKDLLAETEKDLQKFRDIQAKKLARNLP